VQAIVRASLSIIPPGAAVAELIDLVIQPALSRRRDAWLNDLAADVDKLKERPDAPTLEQLSQNEAFVTVMLAGSAAAMRTHQREKLEALRAAVINTALGMAPDEHTQLMFIRFVDELAPLHLRILMYLQDPASWLRLHGIQRPQAWFGYGALLELGLPEMRGQSDVYHRVIEELDARGLVRNAGMPREELADPQSTQLGNAFLAFVTAPGAP